MVPLGLAALLFFLFTLFGKAFLELVRFRSPVLRNWLIAPTVGFALIEILVCFFNQFCSLPVKAVAGWMLLALLLGSAAVLWWRRPVFPGRHLAPFGGVLAFSLLYTGWPALIYGFNWMSYVNGDMTYFSGGAVRMLEHPFYAIPPLQDVLGRDYTQYTWGAHVLAQVRAGGEMLLAWCSGATRLNPLQAYMPLILALQLTQLCAAGALVLDGPRLRRAALLAVAILSLSPLLSLGTLYQLMPQAGGIPAMLVLAILLATEPGRLRHVWPYSLVLATVLSGLFLHYPEVIAFGLVSAVLYQGARVLQRRRIPWAWLGGVAASGVLACVMIREALLAGIVNTLTNVQHAGLTGVTPGNSIFPQYMIPSGLANLFGLLPIGKYPGEPVLSGLILIGLVLLIVVLFQTAGDARKGRIYAYMLGFMIVVGIAFVRGANDYGLFKLAMFCQPALAVCFSFLAIRIFSPWWWVAPVIVLAATIPAQTYYTAASAGLIGAGVVEVPGMSHFGLNFAVPRITAISDINLMPAQGLAAIVFRGSMVLYPSVARGKLGTGSGNSNRSAVAVGSHTVPLPKSGLKHAGTNSRSMDANEQGGIVGRAPPRLFAAVERSQPTGTGPTIRFINSKPPAEPASQAEVPSQPHAVHSALSVRDRVKNLLEALRFAATFAARRFALVGSREEMERAGQMNRLENVWGTNFFEFAPDLLDSAGRTTHLLTLQREFLLNSTSPLKDTATYGVFRLAPYDSVHNWLLFIPSTRGPDYYYERFNASFYQPEVDPYHPGGFMSAVGRFLLLEVLHPTDRLRLRVSLSRSILGGKRVALPSKAVTYGASTAALPFAGAGSATIYSDSIAPLWRNGYAYLALDLGEPASAFPNIKTGLMRLYNQEFSIDHRRLVAFGRDISAVSEEEYQDLVRPRKIDGFPAGLLSDRGLEYSGIYEDGWVSQDSFVKLGAANKGESVIVEGMVPSLANLANGQLTLRVQVNDTPAETQTLKPGSFRLSVRLREPAPVTTVHAQFSGSAPLPGADGRPVSALVHSISIQ
jgi:hypothetical protein